MSMSDNQKYFYFRFKNDFFDEIAIENMEYIPDVGYEMIVTLLKIYLMSVKNKGIIVIPNFVKQGVLDPMEDEFSMTVKYFSKKIGVANSKMNAFVKYYFENGFIEYIENAENKINIKANYVVNNTGNASNKADRQRLAYQENNLEIQEPEKVLALESEDDKRKSSITKQYKIYKKFNNITDEDDEVELKRFVKRLENRKNR